MRLQKRDMSPGILVILHRLTVRYDYAIILHVRSQPEKMCTIDEHCVSSDNAFMPKGRLAAGVNDGRFRFRPQKR
jgi:hypothetical protein